MKKHSFLTLIGTVALTTTLFVGCAKPPQEHLDAAQAALLAAETEEADLYVADLYEAALDSFTAAQVEIEAQHAASRFSRNYDHAASLLVYATQTATEAQNQVETRKEELRTANDTLIAQAEAALTQVYELTAQAPRGKDGAIALVSIQEDADTASADLEAAILAQDSGDLLRAHDLTQSALDKANALIAELNTVVAKTQPGPRS